MLYDSNGKLLSERSPSLEEIRAGFDNYLAKSRETRYASYGDFTDLPLYFLHPGSHGRLSYNELRNLYETSSAIRPAVDSLTREIYGFPWIIIHKDEKYHSGPQKKILTNFFKKINNDNEDIAKIVSTFTNDLLVLGKGVIEKVRNPFKQLLELRAVDAANFSPSIDEDTLSIEGYKEYKTRFTDGNYIIHSKSDIIYKNFSTISYSQLPLPIIETIVNEISVLMLTVKNIGAAFSNDDIPPGILHLGNIGTEALDRAKASFKETKDISKKGFSLKVVDNVDKVNWIQFTRPFREMQLAELIPLVERIVARNFGLAAVDAGLDGGGKTSATIGKQITNSKMLFPLLRLIETSLTNEVIYELDKNYIFKYSEHSVDVDIEYEKNLLSQFKTGLITMNEFRISTGRPPMKNGDKRFVLLGNEFVPIDEKTGLPLYRVDLFSPIGRPPTEDKPEEPPKDSSSETK